MGKKMNLAFEKFKYFCATKSPNFYFGMVFTVFGLLSLTAFIPLLYSAFVSPVLTLGLYFLGRMINETPKDIRGDSELPGKILASLLGCLWVVLFVFI